MNEAVDGWGDSRRGLFGQDSINGDKTQLGGAWSTRGLALGYELDTWLGSLPVPLPIVEVARIYILSVEFVVGSQYVALKVVQTLRGYMQHWSVASLFWSSCVQPLDLLITYGGEDCSGVNCSDFRICNVYWDMLSLSKALSSYVEMRPTHFCNQLLRTLALRQRFSGPMVVEKVRWISTDAAPQVIGAVDWRGISYIRADAEEIMKDYAELDGREAGISDRELMGMAIGAWMGFPPTPTPLCSPA